MADTLRGKVALVTGASSGKRNAHSPNSTGAVKEEANLPGFNVFAKKFFINDMVFRTEDHT
jgi:hypothetical protein